MNESTDTHKHTVIILLALKTKALSSWNGDEWDAYKSMRMESEKVSLIISICQMLNKYIHISV